MCNNNNNNNKNQNQDQEHSLLQNGNGAMPRKCRTTKLYAFGNVLLDYSVRTDTDKILQEFGFNSNELGECSSEKLTKVIEEVEKRYPIVYKNVGGSALNTCKILRTLGEMEMIFFGCIGNDLNGNIIQNILKELNINTCLQIDKNNSTGTCICIIYQQDRCCFANIGASECITKDFIIENLNRKKSPINHHDDDDDDIIDTDNDTVIDKRNINTTRDIFYIEGFFITTSERFNSCKYLINEYFTNHHNLLVINLSAVYIVREYLMEIEYLIHHSDIVFGNRDEFEAILKINNYNKISDIFKNNLNNPKNNNNNNNRIQYFIITNGNQPVEVISYDYSDSSNAEEQPKSIVFNDIEMEINSNEIIDTTGAGDAFVAGFMHIFMDDENCKIRECVENGIKVATKKLKAIGGQLQ